MSFQTVPDFHNPIAPGEDPSAGFDGIPCLDLVFMLDQWFGHPIDNGINLPFDSLGGLFQPGLQPDFIWTMLPPVSVIPNYLLDVSTQVGVGVERTAGGYDDTPLQDFIGMIGTTFGPPAGDAVETAFDGLIDTLGPDLLADVPVMVLPPVFDVNNGRSDFYAVDIPNGPYILDIGSPENVGDGELARIILGFVDGDSNDSDVQQILAEMTTGVSGAELDFEFVPGINGVWLSELSTSHYALDIEDGSATDTLVFTGPGTESAIWGLDSPANLVDDQSRLSLVEVGVEDVKLGYLFQNPIKDLVGDELDSAEDIRALMDAAETGDSRIDMISHDSNYVSMRIYNSRMDTWDTFVFYGDEVEKALDESYVPHEPDPYIPYTPSLDLLS